MSTEPRKRSRFDAEPEPKRPSRFDRRSRSPSRRSRSPIARGTSDSPATVDLKKTDPAAAAAAAAARINAQLQAKKGIQHVDVPPIRSTGSPSTVKSPSEKEGVNGEIYTQDGDYIRDIEVNDLRNRYTLTKGSTQKMIKEETGADVTTRGEYYPDKSMASAASPPLYLHITSQTKEGLEKAIAKINELMSQELPNLVDERRFRRREPEPFERDEFGRRKWPEEKIPIDLEPIPGFNLRAQVVGHGGAYVKHIQGETRCRVQIKGQGSGFIESNLGRESDEPMYLHVSGPDPAMVAKAKELSLDLLGNVKSQYEQFKERGPSQRYGGGHDGGHGSNGYGGGGRGGRDGGYGGRGEGGYGGGRDSYSSGGHHDRQDSYSSQNYGGYGGAQSPTGAAAVGAAAVAGASTDPNAQDYAAQYAAYYAANPDQDPYAAYGGYQNYVTMYYQYYAQQQGATQSPAPGAEAGAPPPPPSGGEAPPPPPPGGDSAYGGAPGAGAPPPPPSGSPPGGYNAVPPPPGM